MSMLNNVLNNNDSIIYNKDIGSIKQTNNNVFTDSLPLFDDDSFTKAFNNIFTNNEKVDIDENIINKPNIVVSNNIAVDVLEDEFEVPIASAVVNEDINNTVSLPTNSEPVVSGSVVVNENVNNNTLSSPFSHLKSEPIVRGSVVVNEDVNNNTLSSPFSQPIVSGSVVVNEDVNNNALSSPFSQPIVSGSVVVNEDINNNTLSSPFSQVKREPIVSGSFAVNEDIMNNGGVSSPLKSCPIIKPIADSNNNDSSNKDNNMKIIIDNNDSLFDGKRKRSNSKESSETQSSLQTVANKKKRRRRRRRSSRKRKSIGTNVSEIAPENELTEEELRKQKYEQAKQKRREQREMFDNLRKSLGEKKEASRGDLLESTLIKLKQLQLAQKQLKQELSKKKRLVNAMKQQNNNNNNISLKHVPSKILHSANSNSLLNKVFGNLSIGLIVWTSNQIISCNACFEQWFGYSESELRHMKIDHVLINKNSYIDDACSCKINEVVNMNSLIYNKKLRNRNGHEVTTKIMSQILSTEENESYIFSCVFAPHKLVSTRKYRSLPGTSIEKQVRMIMQMSKSLKQ